MSDLEGLCVPICTPFRDNGAILDTKALEANIESLIENGVHIIAVNGGTGEFPFLAEQEKRQIAELAAKRIDGRVGLVVQTSAVRTDDAIENSRHAEGLGADAVLVLPPYFEGPGEDGVVWHYEKIAGSVTTPIMVYNIPMFTLFDITPEVFAKLSQFGIRYIKDSTSDPFRIDVLAAQGAKVFCGPDILNFYSLLNGAAGLFSGSGNVVPRHLRKLWDLVRAGEIDEAVALWKTLQPLNRLLWELPFVPAAKAASAMVGRAAGTCRMPTPPLPAADLKRVEETVRALPALTN